MSIRCSIVGCTTGLASARAKNKSEGKRNPSTFSVPKDPEARKLWQRMVPRHNRPLTEKDRVCSLHFRPEDIITADEVDLPEYGIVWRSERKHWVLKKGAHPRIFSHCPTQQQKSDTTCERKRSKNGERNCDAEAKPAKQGKPLNAANGTMKINLTAAEDFSNFGRNYTAQNSARTPSLVDSKEGKHFHSYLTNLVQNYNTRIAENNTGITSVLADSSQERNKRQDIMTWIQNCNAQNFFNDTKPAPVYTKAQRKENVLSGHNLNTRPENFYESNLPTVLANSNPKDNGADGKENVHSAHDLNTQPDNFCKSNLPTGLANSNPKDDQRNGSSFRAPLQNFNPNLPTVPRAAPKPVVNFRNIFTFKKLLEKVDELELPVRWTYAPLMNQGVKGIMLSKWINDELMDIEKRIIVTPQLKVKIFVHGRQIFLQDFTTVNNISSLNNLIYTVDTI